MGGCVSKPKGLKVVVDTDPPRRDSVNGSNVEEKTKDIVVDERNEELEDQKQGKLSDERRRSLSVLFKEEEGEEAEVNVLTNPESIVNQFQEISVESSKDFSHDPEVTKNEEIVESSEFSQTTKEVQKSDEIIREKDDQIPSDVDTETENPSETHKTPVDVEDNVQEIRTEEPEISGSLEVAAVLKEDRVKIEERVLSESATKSIEDTNQVTETESKK